MFLHIWLYFFVFKGTPEPMETHFMLADSVFCKASVPPTEKVCLWLGVSGHHTFSGCW